LNDADDGDAREKELRVKKEAEGFTGVVAHMAQCMPTHKADDCEEGGGGKDVMYRILLWNEYHAEYPAEEDDDGGERPLLTPTFIKHGEARHDEHTQCDEVAGLEYRG